MHLGVFQFMALAPTRGCVCAANAMSATFANSLDELEELRLRLLRRQKHSLDAAVICIRCPNVFFFKAVPSSNPMPFAAIFVQFMCLTFYGMCFGPVCPNRLLDLDILVQARSKGNQTRLLLLQILVPALAKKKPLQYVLHKYRKCEI